MEIIADIGHNQAWNIANGIYRPFYDVFSELCRVFVNYCENTVGGAGWQGWGMRGLIS